MQASTLLPSVSLRPINTGGLRRRVGTLAPLLLAAVTVSSQTGASSADLSQYRNKNRLLFVFAPSDKDTRYAQQFSKFAGRADGFKERDLVRFDVFESGTSRRDGITLSAGERDALRQRFAITKGQFRMLLIGKDGHTAYSASRPIAASQLFGLIDSMPMRRDEMQRQGKTVSSKTALNERNNLNKPNKNLTPAQVVKIQMEALQHNDAPHRDAGIETTFAFASPENKQATGPLEHFITIVKAPAYLPMLNCKSITYDAITVDGDEAKQRVHIVAADGTAITYMFMLSRQTDGPYTGCWMNDGCVREEAVAPDPREI